MTWSLVHSGQSRDVMAHGDVILLIPCDGQVSTPSPPRSGQLTELSSTTHPLCYSL